MSHLLFQHCSAFCYLPCTACPNTQSRHNMFAYLLLLSIFGTQCAPLSENPNDFSQCHRTETLKCLESAGKVKKLYKKNACLHKLFCQPNVIIHQRWLPCLCLIMHRYAQINRVVPPPSYISNHGLTQCIGIIN